MPRPLFLATANEKCTRKHQLFAVARNKGLGICCVNRSVENSARAKLCLSAASLVLFRNFQAKLAAYASLDFCHPFHQGKG